MLITGPIRDFSWIGYGASEGCFTPRLPSLLGLNLSVRDLQMINKNIRIHPKIRVLIINFDTVFDTHFLEVAMGIIYKKINLFRTLQLQITWPKVSFILNFLLYQCNKSRFISAIIPDCEYPFIMKEIHNKQYWQTMRH